MSGPEHFPGETMCIQCDHCAHVKAIELAADYVGEYCHICNRGVFRVRPIAEANDKQRARVSSGRTSDG